MKTKALPLFSRLAILTCGLTALPIVRAADIGSAFTNQGQLKQSGNPVSATCDFRFGLWDAAAGGNPVGSSPQTLPTVGVDDGLFSVVIDFGIGAMDGNGRWLEIEVRCPADVHFVALLPRVELTPAPHAVRAVTGVGGPNVLNEVLSGKVGIGTNAPVEELHVVGDIRCDSLTWASGATIALDNDQGGDIELGDSSGAGTKPFIDMHYGIGAPEDYNIGLQNDSAGRLSVVGNLNVVGNVMKEYSPGTPHLAIPIAYASINSDGTVASGTPNVSSAWDAGNSRYHLTITGESYSTTDYVTIVTPVVGEAPEALFATAGGGTGQPRVRIMSSSIGTRRFAEGVPVHHVQAVMDGAPKGA